MTSSKTAVVSLPSDTDILITREFDAPRHLVWRAWTEPDLIKRWWGGDRGKVTLAEVDLRVGGTWRYVMMSNGDFEVGFHGEFQEIVPRERIVNTEVYEAMPDEGSLCTITFTEHDGRTTMEQRAQYPSQKIRDMVIDYGMEAGMQESMDYLEQVAISLA